MLLRLESHITCIKIDIILLLINDLVQMELAYKQYLITNQRIEANGMVVIPLKEGIRLYVGKDLAVHRGVTEGGVQYFILGEAYCTDSFPRQAKEDLEGATISNAIAISKHWTGRWALILGDELITDASGLMSAFYHSDENGWMVSSSIALLTDILGLDNDKRVSSSGLTWSLLPLTIHDEIRLLYCTQVLLLRKNLSFRFANRFAEWKNLTYNERLTTITSSLITGLKNINSYSGREIWLALTAGKDSRLSFAVALSAGVSFDTYTANHANMLLADKRLPLRLSKLKGIHHHLLQRNKFSKEKYKEYCLFSGNNSLGTDAEFYATGQFDQIPDYAINIKSGLFEAGQVYARSIAGSEEESFISGMKKYYSFSFKNKAQVVAFDDWIEYQRRNSMPGIDIRDRFYLEQRLNGWAAALEQSLDINRFVSIHIANSAAVMGCLLYAPTEVRKDLKLSYDLIRVLDKELLYYPVNQITFRDKARFVIKGIKRRLHI